MLQRHNRLIEPGITLTVDEAEAYCALNVENDAEAMSHQRQAANSLALVFKRGDKRTTADQWKALKYKKQARGDAVHAELNAWNLNRTHSWYALFSWFTSIRLFLSRLNRIGDAAGNAFINNGIGRGFELIESPALGSNAIFNAFKTRLLSIGGFTNGLELAFDLGVLLMHLIHPDKHEQRCSSKQILLNALKKDFRWYRMLNAAIWFTINVTAFICTGGMSSILNLAGFSFDVGHELVRSWVEIRKHTQLLKKINKRKDWLEKTLTETIPEFTNYKALLQQKTDYETRIKEIDLKLQQRQSHHSIKRLNAEKHHLQLALKNHNDQITSLTTIIQNKQPQLFSQYNRLTKVKKGLEAKLHNLKKDRLYTVCVVVGVLIGMGLFFFPPAGIPALAGAIIAFAVGSIIGGLGKRLYDRKDKIAGFFKCEKKIDKNPSELPAPKPKPKDELELTTPTSASTKTLGTYAQLQNRDPSFYNPTVPLILPYVPSVPNIPLLASDNSENPGYVPPTLQTPNSQNIQTSFNASPISQIKQ